jgi:hypothetical protein
MGIAKSMAEIIIINVNFRNALSHPSYPAYRLFYVGWIALQSHIALGHEESQVHYLQNPNGI